MRRFKWVALAARIVIAAGLLCAGASFGSEPYPSKPIRLIVPVAAGGPTDVLARALGQQLAQIWNVPVIVDPRPGGGSNIGFEAAARSPADGYTLLMATPAFSVNVSLYSKLKYDPLRDFSAVTQLTSTPLLLVINPSISARSLKDLVALAKARPGEMNFASAGNGTTTHLAAELFKTVARIDLVHIPYKGSAPAITDLLGGQVHVTFSTPPAVVGHIKSGKLRALAITSPARSPHLPWLPTFAEEQFEGMEVTSWYGVVAPAGTPKAIVSNIQATIASTLAAPALRESFKNLGLDPVGSTPEGFEAFIRNEVTLWAKVVKASGAKVD